jgi:hypothetical protein
MAEAIGLDMSEEQPGFFPWLTLPSKIVPAHLPGFWRHELEHHYQMTLGINTNRWCQRRRYPGEISSEAIT